MNNRTYQVGFLKVGESKYEIIAEETESGEQYFRCDFLDEIVKRIEDVEKGNNGNGGNGGNGNGGNGNGGNGNENSENTRNDEKTFLIENATSAKFIAYRYDKNSTDKNGFSTIQVATILFGIPDENLRKSNGKYLSEIDIAGLIYSAIEVIRKEVTPLQGTNY